MWLLGVPLIALVIVVVGWWITVTTGLARIILNTFGISEETFNYFFFPGGFVVICVALWVLFGIGAFFQLVNWREQKIKDRALSPLQMEDEEIAQKLAQLSKLLDTQYTSDEAAYEKTAAEFRRIGEQLCANGGNKRMGLIAYRTNWIAYQVQYPQIAPPYKAAEREIYSEECIRYWYRYRKYWDGICGFRAKASNISEKPKTS